MSPLRPPEKSHLRPFGSWNFSPLNLKKLIILSGFRDASSLMLINLFFAGLDERGLEGQHMSGGLYGHRSNSSASSSPPATSQSGQTGLVVPQPINAAKGGQGHGGQAASAASAGNNNGGHIHSHPSNGSSGRKYQCKMCPQVGKVGFITYFLLFMTASMAELSQNDYFISDIHHFPRLKHKLMKI